MYRQEGCDWRPVEEYTHKSRVSKTVNHFMFHFCQTLASHFSDLFEVHCVYMLDNNYLVHLLDEYRFQLSCIIQLD